MLRILIITQYYTPEPPMRPCELAPSLAAKGHEVVAVTGFPCYPTGRIYDGYRRFGWQWETIDGVNVLRLPIFPDHSRSPTRRALYYGSIAAEASVAAPLVGHAFDAAFVSSPPVTLGVPGILTKWLRGVPFVYDVQDLWPESLPATGMAVGRPVMGFFDRLGALIYREAAAITVISPGFKNHLMAKGVPEHRLHVISNWADESVYQQAAKNIALGRQLGMNGRFNVVYAGNMGLAQSLTTVIRAAELLRDHEDINFVFVGDGVQQSELQDDAVRRGLPNVHFVGRKTAREMPGIYALADILLIHLRRDPLFSITIPSKTIAYLAAGRAIVAAIDGDAANVVTEANAGLACAPEDPQAMADRIRELRQMEPEARERMGQNGRQAFLKFYSRAVLVDRFEALFHAISKRKDHDH